MQINSLLRKSLVIGIIFLFLGNCVNQSTSQNIEKISLKTSKGIWLYVGGDGPGNYTNIQDAINASFDGDTIFVYCGIYPGYVRVDKSISLIGEDKNTTIIEGGWGYFINIRKNFVLVTGFTVQDCGFDHCGGITINSDNTTIYGNILMQNIHEGIVVSGDYNLITNNSFIGNLRGIGLEGWSKNNTVIGNIIESNTNDGIAIEFWYPSNNNTIRENIIKNNGCGIEILNGNNTFITNNTITYNGCGIDIYGEWSPENPTYRNNTMIENNTIAFNNYGLVFYNANNSHVHHNSILKNLKGQAYDNAYDFQAINIWDNGYLSGGNYWSDYNGSDNYSGLNQDIPGSDGFGDTPYYISGYSMNSKDRYPLMKPFGNEPPYLPVISGPTKGKVGVEYNYTFSISDPDEDGLYLLIDWGDGTNNNWTGEYKSGEKMILKHIWNKKGIFTIRTKIKDIFDIESDWTILEVIMPRTISSKLLFMRFLEQFPILERPLLASK